MDKDRIDTLAKSDGEFAAHRLEMWAELIPEKTFFFYGEEDEHISFKEFNELTNSIAHNLISMGLGKGDRVLVFLKNPVATTLAMFGIWKAGAVFIPVNTSYMGPLLAYQINDTNPKMIITEKNLVPLVNDIQHQVGNFPVAVYAPKESHHDYNPQVSGIGLHDKFSEMSFDALLTGQTSNLKTDLTFQDTANIVYTSGTTGPAKGVVQSHRYVNLYTAFWRNFTNQKDVIYSDLPLYHIGGAFQNVVRAAWVGCTVAVWDKFSPSDFWNRIRVSGSTTAILLDVMIPWLVKAKETPDDRRNTLNKVYMQPMPINHHEIARRFGFDFVITGYGQTEAGNGFAGIFEELREGEGTPPELYKGYSHKEMRELSEKIEAAIVPGEIELKKGFMGRPPFFLQATVLNDDDQECLPGQAGQICFRSHLPNTIFDEYFGKPQATAEVFSNQWFHSGDAGFKDEEGFFYFLDRQSGCIRRRGENISSYHIEDIINGHPSVNCCAAFPIPAAEGAEDDIVVFVVVQPGEELDEGQLRQWIEGKMPKFMQPQHIRFVSDLPRTPTNKLKKYELKEIILKQLQRNC
ncbi:AMP-binding protein [Desulfomonile tiedjei]|uniref:Acyl-CoA synthetase (AMP-forming)/AMP-acid ligase II n=1 Tax=Desulfomonile tiedjei (strain ATCC 49306 / DSM 6799 / DCB-1) TaxID=706587 RepID=I4C5K0_DESTA|nr:AMP-binding protein [Desulfomonile tiedjei]AFM24841.1 acyl-CoA synthetase (AMP-forming)/AMP-acid ligase II [Desulfomonile tiedjei DSM 6799]